LSTLFESHLHTREGSSCATSTLRSQLEACQRRGISAITITDHNSLAGYEAYDDKHGALCKEFPDILVLPGVEVSVDTADGFVHLLVYAANVEHLRIMAQPGGFRSIDDFVAKLDHSQHYVIWAHPGHGNPSVLKNITPKWLRLKLRGVGMRRLPEQLKNKLFNSDKELSEDERRLLTIVDGIEAINGARGDLRKRNPALFREDNGRHPLSAGSDTHIVGETGMALTELEDNPRTVKEIFTLLRNGKYHPLADA
jgi:predicted metal-dependent phosphoesterase TrpH